MYSCRTFLLQTVMTVFETFSFYSNLYSFMSTLRTVKQNMVWPALNAKAINKVLLLGAVSPVLVGLGMLFKLTVLNPNHKL